MNVIMIALASLVIAVSAIVAVSAIWVYWDATAKKIGRDPGEKFKYFDNMSAGLWSFFTLWIWIAGFTMYLVKRRALIERAQAHPVEVKRRRAKLSALGLIGAVGVFGTVLDQLEKGETRSRAAASKSEPVAPARTGVASTLATREPIVDAPPTSKPADSAPSIAPATAATASVPTVLQLLAGAPATSKPNLPVAAAGPATSGPTSTPSTSKPASPLPPHQVTEVPHPKPVAAARAAASTTDLDVKARAKAREEQEARRGAAIEREPEENPNTPSAPIQPALASRAPLATSTSTASAQQQKEHKELTRLSDAGLISQEIYLERRHNILEDTPGSNVTHEGRSLRNYVIPYPRYQVLER